MKLLLASILSLVLMFAVSEVYADIESIETTVYPGVDVDIFGKVTATGDWDRLTLQIFGPDGDMVVEDALLIGPKGDFRSKYESDKLAGFGEYQVKIFHLEDSKIATFDFKPVIDEMEIEDEVICVEGDMVGPKGYCIPVNPIDDAPTIQDKIKDLDEAEERIKELETRVMELENEKSTLEQANEELQRQVDFLQEQLDNISQQFTDSVSQLNEWFVGKVTELQN